MYNAIQLWWKCENGWVGWILIINNEEDDFVFDYILISFKIDVVMKMYTKYNMNGWWERGNIVNKVILPGKFWIFYLKKNLSTLPFNVVKLQKPFSASSN